MAKGKKMKKKPELVLAAEQGDLDTVNLLLDKKKRTKIEERDGCGDTALNIAAFKGQVEVVNELVLGRKANVNTTDERKWTPLISAACGGHVEVIQVLVGKRANLESKTQTGNTALNMAAAKGHTEVVEELLSCDADPETTDKKGWTPLNNAASEGHTEVVRILLNRGVDKNAANTLGFTPLNSASFSGQTEAIELLVEKGADGNIPNKQGFTPLHTAALAGHEDIVQALLKHSQAKEEGKGDKDENQETKRKGPAITINVNSKTKLGFTPLMLAAQEGHKNIVLLMIEKGADINLTTNEGATALHMAAQHGRLSVVMLLCERRATVNTSTTARNTPLISAAKENQLGIVQFLVGKGARVDEQNEEGESALHWAADGGHTDVVKYLVQSKADAKLKDKQGRTPQTRAKKNGKKHEAVIFLKDYESGKAQKKQMQAAKKAGPAQIFISYNWEKKLQMEKLYDKLTFLGYACWMDTHFMGTTNDLYDEVYKGMKNSLVSIHGMTVDYTKSADSRREASLADQMKKPKIPLLMESMSWPPDGPMKKTFTGVEPIPIYEDDKTAMDWEGPMYEDLLERIKKHVPKPARPPGDPNASSSVCVIQ